jgi:hypothetical protein
VTPATAIVLFRSSCSVGRVASCQSNGLQEEENGQNWLVCILPLRGFGPARSLLYPICRKLAATGRAGCRLAQPLADGLPDRLAR